MTRKNITSSIVIIFIITGCSSFNLNERAPSSIENQVFMFYKSTNKKDIILRQCEDNTQYPLLSPHLCPKKNGIPDQITSIQAFKSLLKRILYFSKSYWPFSNKSHLNQNTFSKETAEHIKLYHFIRTNKKLSKKEIENTIISLKKQIPKTLEYKKNMNTGLSKDIINSQIKYENDFLKKNKSWLNTYHYIDRMIDETVNIILSISEENKKIYDSNGYQEKLKQAFPILKNYTKADTINSLFIQIDPDYSKINNTSNISIPKKSFQIMEAETTQIQWYRIMKTNPSFFKTIDHCDNHIQITQDEITTDLCPNNPVENISMGDISSFIKKLNKAADLNCNDERNTFCYRLPTRKEWRYTAYGQDQKSKYKNLSDYGWFSDNSNKQTHPVKSKKKNIYKLYDLYGNISEATQENSKKAKFILEGSNFKTNLDSDFIIKLEILWHKMIIEESSTGFRLVKEI